MKYWCKCGNIFKESIPKVELRRGAKAGMCPVCGRPARRHSEVMKQEKKALGGVNCEPHKGKYEYANGSGGKIPSHTEMRFE